MSSRLESSVEDGILTDFPLKRRLQGLLLFRLLLAIFFLILTLAVQGHREESLFTSHLLPLYFFSVILFLFTIVAALSLKRIRQPEKFGYVQLFFDVGAVTMLIYLSGGVESLFSFLYMPVIISAALLLYRRASLLIASTCSLAYGLLLDLQYFGWVSPLQIVGEISYLRDSGTYFHSILMNTAGFYLVAYLSGYLAEELQKSTRQVRKHKSDFHQLEMLHQNIVQSMSSGLITVGPTEYILSYNRVAQEILCLPPEQLQGQAFRRIFPSLEPHTWPGKPAQTFIGTPSTLERMEVVYRRPSDEELCLGYTVSVLQNAMGETAGWVFIFQDLTHLKAMEEHVRRMERLAFAGKMAAEIAHEIKNPLAAMSGAVQMLKGEMSEGSLQSRLLNIVYREIHRINELVTDFLWLAKGARKPENKEEISVCDIIQDILTLLRAREKITSRHQVQTVFEATPSFTMDPHHFRQILWNLLVNALDAMPENGEIFIQTCLAKHKHLDPQEFAIVIRDTGSGIAEEIRDRVFDPFFTTKKTGTGLGLSIVYQLVENAGGRIEVTHHGQAGTTFSLFFPLTSSFPLAN